MKKFSSIILVFLWVLMPSFVNAQAACTDPLGNAITCAPGVDPYAPRAATPATTATTPAASTQPGTCANGQAPRTTVVNGSTVNQGCDLGYTPLEPIPGLVTGTDGKALNFPELLGNIYKIAITVGALFSVLMLTISGMRYMLSEVGADIQKAKDRIKASIYGLVLIAASYLILYTINPNLLKFQLNPCPNGGVSCNTVQPTSAQTTGSISQPTLSQLTPDQIAKNNLTGKLADTTTLTYTAQNPPTAQQMNNFNNNCAQKGGISTGNQLAGGAICETTQAFLTDPAANATALP